MAASKPNKGQVKKKPVDPVHAAQKGTKKNTAGHRDGRWRPNKPWSAKWGCRVVLRREHGVTLGDVLRVPMRLQTPVLNQLDRDYLFNWAQYSTIRSGQKSRPDGRQLLTLDVDVMFMTEDTADATIGVQNWRWSPDPQRWINELNWISGYTRGAEPQAFRLVITDPQIYGPVKIINMLAKITGVHATQQSGERGVEFVTISFEEYDEDTVGAKQRPANYGPVTWKLAPGDTLYEIAKKSHFHAASAWKTIAKANGITGVSPGSSTGLASWAKKHHKTTIRIPAARGHVNAGGATAAGTTF